MREKGACAHTRSRSVVCCCVGKVLARYSACLVTSARDVSVLCPPESGTAHVRLKLCRIDQRKVLLSTKNHVYSERIVKAPGIDLLRDTVSAFRPKAARLFGAGDPDIQTAFKMLLNGFMIIPGLG